MLRHLLSDAVVETAGTSPGLRQRTGGHDAGRALRTRRLIMTCCLQRNGQLWTETVGSAVSEVLAHDYNKDLAQAFVLTVARFKGSNHWYLVLDGRTPKVQNVVDRLDRWPGVIEQFQKKIRARSGVNL